MDISVHNISLDSFRVFDRYLKPKLEHHTSNFLHLLVYIYIYICRCEIIFFNITFRWTLDINSNHSFHSRIRILLLFLFSCKISFPFHYSHKRIKHLRDCIQNNLLVQLVVQLLRNLFQFALFFARFQKKEKRKKTHVFMLNRGKSDTRSRNTHCAGSRGRPNWNCDTWWNLAACLADRTGVCTRL